MTFPTFCPIKIRREIIIRMETGMNSARTQVPTPIDFLKKGQIAF